jgi:hypothetical protein
MSRGGVCGKYLTNHGEIEIRNRNSDLAFIRAVWVADSTELSAILYPLPPPEGRKRRVGRSFHNNGESKNCVSHRRSAYPGRTLLPQENKWRDG